jgi:hypothetical protein
MTGTLSDRLADLRRSTGSDRERLSGSVEVDQVYAHYQHERLDLHHPRGGMAKYLERPLMDNYRVYLEEYAREVLSEDGGHGAMKRAMEDLAGLGGVARHAPVEFSDLRMSGHPQVKLGDETIYDRPPVRHRLTKEELRIKSRIRYMSLPDALKGWIWWHVQHHTEPPPRHRG